MENERKYRAVVDIDGVIATGGKEVYSYKAGWAFEKCVPIPDGVALLRSFRQEGVGIILCTARWESDRKKTEEWLKEHDIPYDSLKMGKPSGDIYIDDRAYRFIPEVSGQIGTIFKLMKEKLN